MGKGSETEQNWGKTLVGTSGYSYPDWVGNFYPVDLPRDRWLDHYGETFGFCELNFSFYRMPTARQLERYAATDLRVAIKAHQQLTHQREDAENPARAMQEAMQPLLEQGNLAAVLLQFPFSFHYTAENRRWLARVSDLLHDFPLVVEFRHPEWIRDSVLKGLQERGVGIAATDAPQVAGAMPLRGDVSGKVAYLRFHGRNSENWYSGNNVSRYDYEYGEGELREWLPRIEEMARQSAMLYISFNNHARGQAVRNAIQLRKILQDQGLTVH